MIKRLIKKDARVTRVINKEDSGHSKDNREAINKVVTSKINNAIKVTKEGNNGSKDRADNSTDHKEINKVATSNDQIILTGTNKAEISSGQIIPIEIRGISKGRIIRMRERINSKINHTKCVTHFV